MLAYAVPFAAGFAATLAYHRMTVDNELTAAHAGGISHRAMLAPAAITALVLSLVVLTLHDQVIPGFLRRMQKLVTVDVSRLIASEVARGNAVQQKNLMIYADSGRSFGPDPASGALDRVVLSRFAALELDRAGNPTTEASSNVATMWLFPGDDTSAGEEPAESKAMSRVVMRLQNVVALKQREWTTGSKDTVLRWNVPDMFRDSPAFLTYGELRQLATEPARMSGINFPRRDLAILIAERDARAELEKLARSKGEIRLEDSRGSPVTIELGGFAWNERGLRMLPPPTSREVRARLVRGLDDSGQVSTIISAAEAYLITDMGEDRYTRDLQMDLDFIDARTREQGSATEGTQRGDLFLTGLRMPRSADGRDYLAPYIEKSTKQVLAEADSRTNDEFMLQSANELRRKIRNLDLGVLAKLHERISLSVSCGLAILIGALAAMKMSRRTPLAIYLWSFVPAIATIVTIQGGTQVTKSAGENGLILLWCGVVVLVVYTLILFRSVTRH
jgi:lipopolysaccharide export LptBFGC system permease protein LptF